MTAANPFLTIQPVQDRRCWGVSLACRLQLESRRPQPHECKQAGRCIFAPKDQPASNEQGAGHVGQ